LLQITILLLIVCKGNFVKNAQVYIVYIPLCTCMCLYVLISMLGRVCCLTA